MKNLERTLITEQYNNPENSKEFQNEQPKRQPKTVKREKLARKLILTGTNHNMRV